MKILPSLLLLFSLFATFRVSAGVAREEAILIFENRKIAIAVPPGFEFSEGKDEAGLRHVSLATAGKKVSLDLVFVPERDGEGARSRARKEKMVELFQEYVASSVEQAMRFEELEPRRGAGTYCVFTDASLVGRQDLPAGEYLHLTAGVKSWPGVFVVFRLFSQDTTSAAYLAGLKLLRESVEERSVPLR
jgi:hypothetical protein